MWPKLQLLAATAAVIAVCLLVTAEATLATEAGNNNSILPQLLPLPTVPQNATTPQSNDSNDDDDDDGLILSDSGKEVSSSPRPSLVNDFDR